MAWNKNLFGQIEVIFSTLEFFKFLLAPGLDSIMNLKKQKKNMECEEDSASVFLALETIRRMALGNEIGSFPKGLMDLLFMTFCLTERTCLAKSFFPILKDWSQTTLF